MKISAEISDDVTLRAIGNRVARYRLNRNLTQEALANQAGVSKRTIIRVEQGRSTQTSNFIRILRALKLAGNLEALIPEPAISPIQQVKMQGKKRKRASSPAEKTKPAAPWSWGDNAEGDGE
jgi:transcriptional regulator with XRE-family HTH domain|tara:strand:- start:1278 stop:1643 length:366 start_codon:yes stop_codon:yes gene_type:complete